MARSDFDFDFDFDKDEVREYVNDIIRDYIVYDHGQPIIDEEAVLIITVEEFCGFDIEEVDEETVDAFDQIIGDVIDDDWASV